jgi:hypothetical protein
MRGKGYSVLNKPVITLIKFLVRMDKLFEILIRSLGGGFLLLLMV